MSAVGPEGSWPQHPLDDDGGEPAPWTLYEGAAGILWALGSLASTGVAEVPLDLPAGIERAVQGYRVSPDYGAPSTGLCFGETGVALVAALLTRRAGHAERVLELVRENAASEANELMVGAPGTMLAAHVLHRRTGDPRFEAAWVEGAERLAADRGEDGVWVQRLFGNVRRMLGPAHGFAGNVHVLAQGGATEELRARTEDVLERYAVREGGLVNWPPQTDDGLVRNDTIRMQWCHGAPGMVASLWDLAPEELLLAGGELTWEAGPLAKGPGFCHGTAGNGYAFLKLFALTGDELWLDRARAFGMHALAQVGRAREEHGRGRFSLFTGDVGVALYLRACLDGSSDVPAIDAW